MIQKKLYTKKAFNENLEENEIEIELENINNIDEDINPNNLLKNDDIDNQNDNDSINISENEILDEDDNDDEVNNREEESLNIDDKNRNNIIIDETKMFGDLLNDIKNNNKINNETEKAFKIKKFHYPKKKRNYNEMSKNEVKTTPSKLKSKKFKNK